MTVGWIGGVLVAAMSLSVLTACGFYVDPTEATFYVNVLNDTNRTVVVGYCGTGDGICSGHVYSPLSLKPSETYADLQTSVDALNVELVMDRSGRRLGCIPAYFNYHADGFVLRVSQRVPCSKSYPVREKP